MLVLVYQVTSLLIPRTQYDALGTRAFDRCVVNARSVRVAVNDPADTGNLVGLCNGFGVHVHDRGDGA